MAITHIGVPEVQRFIRQTFTVEGRAEKKREAEMKTYQSALVQFNQAFAPLENTVRSLGDAQSLIILSPRKEIRIKEHPTFPCGQISYYDVKVSRKGSTLVFTAITDVDDWMRVLAKKNTDGNPTYQRKHARRIRKDILAMDENGDITSTESGHGYTKVSRAYETYTRLKFSRRFRNVKHIVDSVEMKPVLTLPEKTVAVIRMTQLLQKASTS